LFYRHFEEVIRRGYLYIAQPPLYKVSKGKRERYIKDDSELATHLLEAGMAGKTLTMGNDEVISDATLVTVVKKMIDYNQLLLKLSARGYPQMVVETMLVEEVATKEFFVDETNLGKIAQRLNDADHEASIITDQEHGGFAVEWYDKRAGVRRKVNWDLVMSVEYQRLITIRTQIKQYDVAPFVISGEKAEPVTLDDKSSLVDHILASSKEGVNIQRYKGLGEMNPDQLWETTMDPDRRTLLQVRIDDAIEADNIFTLLMGEQVEPRREFIQNHALEVRQLDV
jgi:DNA gyrase subunit B